ncbi:MAG: DUF6986 family protein [Spirochaetia bacterium]
MSARGIRTLDLFLSALCEATGGRLPENFVVTLPKVVIPEQTAALANLLESMEPALHVLVKDVELPVAVAHLEVVRPSTDDPVQGLGHFIE